MSKRTLLSQVIKAKTQTTPVVVPEAEAIQVTQTGQGVQRGSRIGTRMLGFHVPEPVQRQFKVLAAEQGKTVHALLQEAVNDLFRKYDKETIA
jgi:hypothetical protein